MTPTLLRTIHRAIRFSIAFHVTSAYGHKRLHSPVLQHDRFEALTGRFGLRGPLAARKLTSCRIVADDRL
jgi:hypothetical protein